MATTFVWDEATQSMKPTSHSILEILEDAIEPVDAVAAADNSAALTEVKEQLKQTKKRGKTAAYDAGKDAVMVSAKIPESWLKELMSNLNTDNKSFALYSAVKAALNK